MYLIYSGFLPFIFRAIFRLVLLLRNKSGLQTSPPIIPLDRGVELNEEGLLSLLRYMVSFISLIVVNEIFLACSNQRSSRTASPPGGMITYQLVHVV